MQTLKNSHSRTTLACIIFLFLAACAEVPVTDRNQLNLISSSKLQEMSYQQYQAFLDAHEISNNQNWTRTVDSVGVNIASAVESYMRETGNQGRIEGFDWQFTLVKSDERNAFAMPGGKVVIYEGIMDMIDGNAAELATVVSHEIAHVVAQHGNERMSQQMLAQLGGAALGTAIDEKSAQTQQAFMTAYGVTTQVGVLLPYSRTQESEADEMGLIFLAKAGYAPREAIDFWQKMQAASDGGAPPELLSTHPAADTRISDIRDKMPKALDIYRGERQVSSR